MNPEVKQQWLRDLRSGQYQQGQKALRENTVPFRHCCLGVLADKCPIGSWYSEGFPYDYYRVGTHEDSDYLTGQVLIWAGLSDSEQKRLARMNDEGCTFAEIADYIEANL